MILHFLVEKYIKMQIYRLNSFTEYSPVWCRSVSSVQQHILGTKKTGPFVILPYLNFDENKLHKNQEQATGKRTAWKPATSMSSSSNTRLDNQSKPFITCSMQYQPITDTYLTSSTSVTPYYLVLPHDTCITLYYLYYQV